MVVTEVKSNKMYTELYVVDIIYGSIRPQTRNCEVSGLNLLAAAVVPLGKARYPLCLVPQKGLKASGPLVAYKQLAFLVAR